MQHAFQIETERLILREFDLSDAEALFRICCQKDITDIQPEWKMSREQTAGFLHFVTGQYQPFREALPDITDQGILFAITLKESGELIGWCGTWPKEGLPCPNREVAYALSKTYWGTGYMTEAVKALIAFLFEHTGIEQLSGVALPRNKASQRVLEKCGFRYAGRLTLENKEYIYYKYIKGLSVGYEQMAAFFDRRVEGYDAHMEAGHSYLVSMRHGIQGIKRTEAPVTVLDLGCGTGAELAFVFEKAPNARVVCMDMSAGMLEHLKNRYSAYQEQLQLVCGSYTEDSLGREKYDYILAFNTTHHLLAEEKGRLYRHICRALKPDGIYIEGDYVVHSEEEVQKFRTDYLRLRSEGILKEDTDYHVDIPLTADAQVKLLQAAGFAGTG